LIRDRLGGIRGRVIRALNARYWYLESAFFDGPTRILDAGGGPVDARKAKQVVRDCWVEGVNIASRAPGADGAAYDRYHQVDLNHSDLAFLDDGSFDLVVASHTIEHLEDGLSVVRQLCRKVRPGGRLYLEWPAIKSLSFPIRGHGLNFWDDPTHTRTYPLTDVLNVVERAGLTVERAEPRRQLARMVLAPLLIVLHSLRSRRLVLFDLWDVTGFALVLWARRVPSQSSDAHC
jgi:SAM-dependent methyltransferase